MRLLSRVFLSLAGLGVVCNLTSCGGNETRPLSPPVTLPGTPSPSLLSQNTQSQNTQFQNTQSPEPQPGTFQQQFQQKTIKTSVALPTFIPATQAWPLVYVLKTRSVTYWQRMERAALEWSQQLGVELTVVGSDHPQTAQFVEDQILLINQQLEAGTLKGLLLGPADSLQLVPIVEKAVAQGIPVIILDTPVNTDAPLCFVGFDNGAAGQAIGSWVVEQLRGKGRVLILEGAQHNDNALERSQGFLAGLRTGQEIMVLDRQPADWDYGQAKKLTADWLNQYPQVDAIVAANDDMALVQRQR